MSVYQFGAANALKRAWLTFIVRMKRAFIWLFGILALIHGLVVFALDMGAPGMRARVRIACRHATYFDPDPSRAPFPRGMHDSIPKIYPTRQDLEQCPEKVRKDYEEFVQDAYRLTDPERHWPMWLSLLTSVCLFSAAIMLDSSERARRVPPKIES